MTKLYAEISKMEAQDDGTIKVWGYASSETVDSDGETITADAMKAAIPDYMKFGAVREMHGKSAAGTAIEINVEDDGRTFFGAHVVDPVAVKKVQTGVYKGFSIGGSVTGRDELNKSVINGIKLTEISLVDRPANPDAVFTCYKADKGADAGKYDADDDADDKDDKPSENPDDGDKDDKDDDKSAKKDGDAEKAEFSADEIAALRKMLKSTSEKGEPVEKSMYQVKSLASVLQEVQWFIGNAEWEAKHDNNTMPDDVVSKAKNAAKTLSDALVVLVAAEAGKISGESAADDAAKADVSDGLNKTAEAEQLAKVQAERDNALAELEALKKQAEPPKGSLMAISKAEDNGGNEDILKGFTPITNHDGTLNEAATLVKAAQTGRL